MSPMQRYANKQAQTRQRRRLKAPERLKPQRAQAQHSSEALHQALKDLDVPETVVAEIAGRLPAQQKLLGTIVALLVPTLCGCRPRHARTRGRGGDTHVPSRLLNAVPTRSWLTRLRRWGREMLVSIGRHTQDHSASPHRRWPWRWGVDAAVFRTYGTPCGLVGTWDSGPFTRAVPGLDGVLLLVVMGDGTRLIPVDLALRRPHPQGPGRRCQDKRSLTQRLRDECVAALAPRGGK